MANRSGVFLQAYLCEACTFRCVCTCISLCYYIFYFFLFFYIFHNDATVFPGLCVRWAKPRRASILGTYRSASGLASADQNSWRSPPSTTTLWWVHASDSWSFCFFSFGKKCTLQLDLMVEKTPGDWFFPHVLHMSNSACLHLARQSFYLSAFLKRVTALRHNRQSVTNECRMRKKRLW